MTQTPRQPERISYRFDDVTVDRENFRVVKGGETRTLTPRAFDLLVFLVEHGGRVVEKQELFDEVWEGAFVTDNALTKAVKEIRQAIGDDASAPRYIETVPKRGYRFVAEVERDRPVADPEVERERPVADRPVADTRSSTPTRRPSTPLLATASVLLLVAVGVLLGRFAFRDSSAASESIVESPSIRLAQVTTWSGLDMYPTFSPDGKSIAFCSDRSGSFEIYARQLVAGGREVQVTSDGRMNVEPEWSPDGTMLAYHSQLRGGIWVVPAFGGVARRLSEFGSRPRWSPDGSSIAFQSDELTDIGPVAFGAMPPSTIWVMSADGGAPRQITQLGAPSGGHGSPAWSPDGRRLVFATYGGGLDALWTVPRDGGDVTRVTDGEALMFDPIWSPDGTSIYYVATTLPTKNCNVLRVRVSTESGAPVAAPVKVADTGRFVSRHLSISPDGKQLIYSAVAMTNDVWALPVSPATGDTTGPSVALTSDTSFRKSSPVFSPDGTKVAYTSKLTGATADIWYVGADGRGPVQVTTGSGMNGFPSWFPDGRRIAYLSWGGGPPEIKVFDLDAGSVRSLFTWSGVLMFPRLSHDGSTLAFQSARDGAINIWTVRIPGGEPTQVTFDRELAGWPCWSPDGARLAFEVKRGNDTHIAVVPSAGGEVEQLTSDPGQSWTGSWSPDGDRIAFAGQRDGIWNIWWVSRTAGTKRRLTDYTRPNVYVRSPDWSPKGDRIVYEYSEVTGNIWLLEVRQ
jgi:Tol biopolymer transport system component/DNA-binding winged helix-turn-helix (wHTH) protein